MDSQVTEAGMILELQLLIDTIKFELKRKEIYIDQSIKCSRLMVLLNSRGRVFSCLESFFNMIQYCSIDFARTNILERVMKLAI